MVQQKIKSRVFLYLSLAVDLVIAVSKFVAAVFTGSSSIVAEGVHSLIDAASQLLLMWGTRNWLTRSSLRSTTLFSAAR